MTNDKTVEMLSTHPEHDCQEKIHWHWHIQKPYVWASCGVCQRMVSLEEAPELTAERRRADAFKKAKQENDERFQLEIADYRSRLQEAEKTIENLRAVHRDYIKFENSKIANLESKLHAQDELIGKCREDLAYIRKILPDTNDLIDAYLKDRSHELYHLLCVDVPSCIDDAIIFLERYQFQEKSK